MSNKLKLLEITKIICLLLLSIVGTSSDSKVFVDKGDIRHITFARISYRNEFFLRQCNNESIQLS